MIHEDANPHVRKIAEALADRGIGAVTQPFHLDTIWVHLADRSILQIADYDDNLGLVGTGGYCVYRDLDGSPVGGTINDPGLVVFDPACTFAELIDRIVEECDEVGQWIDVCGSR